MHQPQLRRCLACPKATGSVRGSDHAARPFQGKWFRCRQSRRRGQRVKACLEQKLLIAAQSRLFKPRCICGMRARSVGGGEATVNRTPFPVLTNFKQESSLETPHPVSSPPAAIVLLVTAAVQSRAGAPRQHRPRHDLLPNAHDQCRWQRHLTRALRFQQAPERRAAPDCCLRAVCLRDSSHCGRPQRPL